MSDNINFDYKNLSPFKWFVLENFPFIEADFDALTEWQLFCKLGKEMNKIINSENTLGTQVENVTNAFIELQKFVNNYFANLDVQEEINNKLNTMAQDGTLQNIISEFLKIKTELLFNSVSEMLTSNNLIEGSTAKTLGYYNFNDGGTARYKIVNDNSLIVDNMTVYLLNNGLKAVLIYDTKINIMSLGARKQDKENNKYDIKPYIEKYFDLLDKNKNILTLYIPAGVWYCSAYEILYTYGFVIEGDNPSWQTYASGGTTICSYVNNQSYIFKIGSSNVMVNNFTFKNITFSSGDFLYFENGNNFRIQDNNTKIIESALNLYYAGFGIFENIAFNHIIGHIIAVTSSWEMRFDKLFISNCSNINDCLIDFRPIDTTLNENANISNFEIQELNVEAINGNIIKTQLGCCLIDSVINNFHFEPFTCNLEKCTQHELNDGEFDSNNVKHLSLFDINGDCHILVNNILLNNIAFRYIKNDNTQYIYDTIYNITNTNKYAEFCSQVDNIIIQGMKRTLNILLQETIDNTVKASSTFILNNIINTTPFGCIFNVKYFPTIINKAILRNTRNQMLSLMNNNFNAFCNYTRNADNDLRRFLFYDSEVINDNLLAVKPNTTTAGIFCNTSIKGNKINIRAKIENGKTYKLTIAKPDYSRALSFELLGTGKYKLYELDMTPISAFFKDDPKIILYSANKEEIDVSLDYFYFE